ncbi:hypothetical protein BU25DRAFT_453578 [Macroventuria anomochaeta]|uniref:Uncharacterized protein n=1 Tax=Macroventuria anomochaeta TaxID=301207 RepID=A0ACB6SJY0_9PLEO|nr:uncharacterized protein BU25DRAFT_453578 [Macroventuria anomochaeta]KAF2633864.1 hypothetical protein BU25DRAFT_453578 [Macroventuria anomochaeta]
MEIKIPGNSMTKDYYTENILLVYREAYKALKKRSNELRGHIPKKLWYKWYFQEDNDPSHGTKNIQSKPALFKKDAEMEYFYHPANSPDFNPIEAMWLIIKE